MSLFQFVFMSLLVVIAQTQEFQNCTFDTSTLTIASTDDARNLAASILECPNDHIDVEWVGEVFVEETIRVTGGASLGITGAGPGAIADGGGDTQLFVVEGGSRLHLSDMTLSKGNASHGGAIFANQSTGNMSFISNSAAFGGGAIAAWGSSTVSWVGDGTQFLSNSVADGDGGAIMCFESNVSWSGDGTQFCSNSAVSGGAIWPWLSIVYWEGDGTQFCNNSASWSGGAICWWRSTVSWDGDGTQFRDNSASWNGGAIWSRASNVSWDGDGTQFNDNFAASDIAVGEKGGAISSEGSAVSWVGDGTQFSNNFASSQGGAIAATDSSDVFWAGDDTQFSNNSAVYDASTVEEGGAIYSEGSTVSWVGDGTQFSNNSAAYRGGAIFATDGSTLSLGENTTFSSNAAYEDGGALALIACDPDDTERFESFFVGTAFIGNSAGTNGGAVFFENCETNLHFLNGAFQSNSATKAGGAVAAHGSRCWFLECTFSNNKADGTGGAVETLLGSQGFASCEFEGNSADVGGAVRLGGVAYVQDCSFLSNSARSRGPAVAVVASAPANVSESSFDGNELYCGAGLYREDTVEEDSAARFATVCYDCPDWDACSDCTIERGDVTPACEAPLEHTMAIEPGTTLETLDINEGFWRATNKSDNILACYNPDACSGGQTGAGSFCAPGYKGPYCAVCETDYSPSLAHTCTLCSSSRRQGLMAATVIAALVAVVAVVALRKYLLSTEAAERNTGSIHRRVLRAVPVQALKIIVVGWQIVIQFADAANLTYPGVYQDFLSAIDIVNFDLGSVLAAGCLWSDIDFHGRLLVSTMGPLVVAVFLAITYGIAVRRNGTSGDLAAVENIRHKHLTALLFLTFLVYSSVSSMIFQTYACDTVGDGIEYLRADYRIQCTDAKHKAFEVYAGIMVFVYPVGIPLLYAVVLFQRSDVLAHAGADKTAAQSVAALWEAYRPECFYYEIVECGRRIMLTGEVVFIFPDDAAQIAITMLIAFFFLLVFEMLSPYKSESDMWLSRGGHVIVYLGMFDLLLLRVDVSHERDRSQAAFAGVLVAGNVLMILVIVVEVIGICYASRKKKVDDGEEEEEACARPPLGSDDDEPAFESAAPASLRSFLRQGSVSEKPGPTRSVPGTLVSTDRP